MRKLEDSIREKNEHNLNYKVAPEDVNYSDADSYIPLMESLVSIRHCAVAIYDYCSKSHFYVSQNFLELFGFGKDLQDRDYHFYRRRVHPEDYHLRHASP